MTAADNEKLALLTLCERAGIPPEDIIEHPEHGLMVAARSVGKLRALAPPSYASAELSKMATDAARAAIKRVE